MSVTRLDMGFQALGGGAGMTLGGGLSFLSQDPADMGGAGGEGNLKRDSMTEDAGRTPVAERGGFAFGGASGRRKSAGAVAREKGKQRASTVGEDYFAPAPSSSAQMRNAKSPSSPSALSSPSRTPRPSDHIRAPAFLAGIVAAAQSPALPPLSAVPALPALAPPAPPGGSARPHAAGVRPPGRDAGRSEAAAALVARGRGTRAVNAPGGAGLRRDPAPRPEGWPTLRP